MKKVTNIYLLAGVVFLFTIFGLTTSIFSIKNTIFADDSLGAQKNVVSNQILIKFSEENANLLRSNIIKNPEKKIDFEKSEISGLRGLDKVAVLRNFSKIEPMFKHDTNNYKKSKLNKWFKITVKRDKKDISQGSVEFKELELDIENLKKISGVESINFNEVVQAEYTPNDTYYSNQYAPALINTDDAWDLTEGTSSAVVAVIDTGILSNHPDLSGRIISSIDYTDSANGTEDVHGHGTHVAGIIAANTNNSTGVAGIASKASLLNVKALSDAGSGTIEDVAEAIEWSADNGANVINMSLGNDSDCTNQVMIDAVDYAWEEDVVLVAAGGNSATNDIHFPANCENVISVAAVNSSDSKPSFSNYHQDMTIAAPGDIVYSTHNNTGGLGYYRYLSGTSMATPMVAGAAALVKSANDYLSNQEIYNILTSSANPITGTGTNWKFGRLDVLKALAPATRIDDTSTYCVAGGPEPRIHLQWTSVPSASSYNIYRKPVGGSESYFGNTSGIAMNDDTVYAGQQYTYRVQANLPNSNTLSGPEHSITSVVCGYPNFNNSSVAYCVGGGSTSRIHLQWDSVADTNLYKVYRTPSGGSESLIGTTSGIAMNDDTVSGGLNYSYRVEAWFPDNSYINGNAASYTAVNCP